jgi:hypothetical protein
MTRTTTSEDGWPFYFTITDLGRFLGKSPVTLRGWEDKGFVTIPRDPSGDRKLRTTDIRRIADRACEANRITKSRRDIVGTIMTLIELVEKENDK